MSINNVEIQDSSGNIYYPHTDASVVKFGDSDVATSLSEKANKNLLINSFFKNPINQRGSITYNTTAQYTIDRWQLLFFNNGSLKVNNGYITLANTIAGNTYLRQLVDTEFSQLIGSKLTVTIKYRTSLSKFRLSILGTDFYPSSSTDWKTVSYTFDISSYSYAYGDNIMIQLYDGSSFQVGSVDIEYIKLELGSIATPFIPRLYAEELALCQRYYEATVSDFPFDGMYNGSIATCHWRYKVQKRIAPTITFGHGGISDKIFVSPTNAEFSATIGSSLIDHARIAVTSPTFSTGAFTGYGYAMADAEIYL